MRYPLRRTSGGTSHVDAAAAAGLSTHVAETGAAAALHVVAPRQALDYDAAPGALLPPLDLGQLQCRRVLRRALLGRQGLELGARVALGAEAQMPYTGSISG